MIDKKKIDNEIKVDKSIRLRFAPSPTGFLHIGNLRTALFGYFLAKSMGGDFILRLEDTDSKREVAGALDGLLEVFKWLGLEFDEGPHKRGEYGPYTQSERIDLYKPLVEELLARNQAYPCFCTPERLDEMRNIQQAQKLPPRYDRHCRSLSHEEVEKNIASGMPYVIRQKMPLSACVSVYDEIRGKIKFSATDLDDQVLIKSNGIPTYQFASVVDDHLMKISHVTRGDEWLPSFPKNILLYQSFSWQAPKFIHLPLILNKSGGKLSKRQGDVFVEDYRKKGYLPEAIINFCILLGWHPKGDKEILSKEEIIAEFSISGIGASPSIFDEEKLDYLNGYYIRQKSIAELRVLCNPYLLEAGLDLDEDKAEKFLSLAQERMKTLSEAPELISFLNKLPDYESDLLVWKKSNIQDAKLNLQTLRDYLFKISGDNWQKDKLEESVIAYIKEIEGKNGDYLWPLRVALSGLKNSPTPFEIAFVLGKEETISRIDIALSK